MHLLEGRENTRMHLRDIRAFLSVSPNRDVSLLRALEVTYPLVGPAHTEQLS